MTMSKQKTFSGFSFTPLELVGNSWDGFGLTLLLVQLIFRGKVTESTSYCLFSLKYRDDFSNGHKKVVILIIPFVHVTLWERIIIKAENHDNE